MAVDYFTLPDLIVHPDFYAHVCRTKDVRDHFNVLEPSRLTVLTDDTASATVICDDGAAHVMRVELEPHYDKCIGSGVRPNVTSYTFERRMPLYRVAERAPRYAVWTEDEALPVCATVLARTDVFGLSAAVRAAVRWSQSMTITKSASVIVFDLDRTLIDDRDRILDGAVFALRHARRVYDKMVLWSHGSPLHVDTHVAKLERFDGVRFDLALSSAQCGDKSCKNLLYLYNYFTNTCFTKATLVDDSVFNWTPEYTHLVVPNTVASVKRVAYAI